MTGIREPALPPCPGETRSRICSTPPWRDCTAAIFLVQVGTGAYTRGMFVRPCGTAELEQLLASDTPILEYLDCRGRDLHDLDFSGRHLRWVRFSGATLRSCRFEEATLECVFADLTTIETCSFVDAFIFESVFAGARLRGASVVGSTADQCSFNAIDAADSDFSDASLRQSRFLNASLTTVKFINCDIKNALFQFSERREVSFKHSNFEEACF